MITLVSADIDGTKKTQLSAGAVHMGPQHCSLAHSHPETDVIVLLLDSGPDGTLTLFGDQLQNEIWQQPLQVLSHRADDRAVGYLELSRETEIGHPYGSCPFQRQRRRLRRAAGDPSVRHRI